jgi:hypothetical protein
MLSTEKLVHLLLELGQISILGGNPPLFKGGQK